MTYTPDALHPNEEEKEFVYPVPLQQLPSELKEEGVEKSKYAPYGMRDLTVGSWVRLGRQIGDEKRRKLRKKFRKYMFMGGSEE